MRPPILPQVGAAGKVVSAFSVRAICFRPRPGRRGNIGDEFGTEFAFPFGGKAMTVHALGDAPQYGR